VPPLLVQTPANPDGVPISVFNGLRASVQADRSQFWIEYSLPFYGYNRPGAKVSEGVRREFWLQGQMAGFPGAFFCIKAFSETDQHEDLMKFDIPTLIIQGTDDQIVPYTLASLRQHQIIKGSILKLYNGAPHGLITTLKDQINEELLAFCR
jgi:non-heme chloroperoxidase